MESMMRPFQRLIVPKKRKDEEDKRFRSSSHLAGPFSEFLFVLLPLVVITFVSVFRGEMRELFFSPEWAFGAAVIFGQTMVKIVLAVGSAVGPPYRPRLPNVAFLISIIIVFGLAPSLVTLAFLLDSHQPPVVLGVSQIVLFVLSFIVWMTIGAASSEFIEKDE
jgi:hypothetical protein